MDKVRLIVALLVASLGTAEAGSFQMVAKPVPAPAPKPSISKVKPSDRSGAAKRASNRSTHQRGNASNCSKPLQRNCSSAVVVYPYYSYPVYATPVWGSSVSYDTATSRDVAENDERYEKSYEADYWKLGRDWGQDLRREIVTFDEFIGFVAERIAPAPESLRYQFRQGFIAGYGQHGAEALDKALAIAKEQSANEGW